MVLAADGEDKRARLACELLESSTHTSTAERVKAFLEQCGGCRATFVNWRRLKAHSRAADPGRPE